MAKEIPFHPSINKKYSDNSIAHALEAGTITEEDATLIKVYSKQYKVKRKVGDLRVMKSIFELVNWRKFILKPYTEATIEDIYDGIAALENGTSKRGRPFKANTLHDYHKALRWFLIWLVDKKHSTISKGEIMEIKPHPMDHETTRPDDVLTREQIMAMINAARSPRAKALIALLYETGGRVGEVARLTWQDIIFDEYGIRVHISDTKNKKVRYIRCRMSTEYLATWRSQYPGSPEGAAVVFLDTKKGTPIQYPAVVMLITRAARAAGIEKRVHPHLFRKTRITHLISEHYQESIIKQAMWGNVSTNMFRTYAVLSESDIDNEFLARQGVTKKKKAEKPITAGECPHCGTLVAPDSQFCRVCGRPLTPGAEDVVDSLDRLVDIDKIINDRVEEALRKKGG